MVRRRAYKVKDSQRHGCFGDSLRGAVHSLNEDAFGVFCDLGLYVVADGVGGHQGGEVASSLAVQVIAEIISAARWRQSSGERAEELLHRALEAANESILAAAQANRALFGMATTVSAVLTDQENVHIAYVGDSRVYRSQPDGRLERLTQDHSPVQRLVDSGIVTEQQARAHPMRHVIDRALGLSTRLEIDSLRTTRETGDRFLLCSDGLTRVLTEEEIAAVLRTPVAAREQVAQLLGLARDRRASDDVTAIVLGGTHMGSDV